MRSKRDSKIALSHVAAILSIAAGLAGILGMCGFVAELAGMRGIACAGLAGALGLFTLVESCFAKRSRVWMLIGVVSLSMAVAVGLCAVQGGKAG